MGGADDKPLSRKMLQVLVALLDAEYVKARAMTPNDVAYALGYAPGMARGGNISWQNTVRVMGPAVHVTTALTALRQRGLVDFGPRPDGLSGTAYSLTDAGAREARAAREDGVTPGTAAQEVGAKRSEAVGRRSTRGW